MRWSVVGVVLLLGAASVAWPDPLRRLRTLNLPALRTTHRTHALLHGRAGALPLRLRGLLGLLAGSLIVLVVPTGWGPWVGVAVAVTIVVLGGQLAGRSRSTGVLQAELADTVELLAVCLAAGSSMRQALRVVAEVSDDETAGVLARVSGLLDMGVTEQQAWLELRSDPVWGQVACDVSRSARSGTSLVGLLHVHAEEARLIAQEQALQRARTAGVRSVVPLMACFLPAFVLVGVLPIIAGLLTGLLSP